MDGLKGRRILSLPPDQQNELEALAQHMTNWENSARSVCTKCFRDWWKPALASSDHCGECCDHHGSTIRGYTTRRNGTVLARVLCLTCGKFGDVRRDDMAPILDVCLRNDTPLDKSETCEHCGESGVERHHWAPRAVFNDADDWPTALLCRRCHREWHSAMRSAGGAFLPKDRRFGERPAPWYAA